MSNVSCTDTHITYVNTEENKCEIDTDCIILIRFWNYICSMVCGIYVCEANKVQCQQQSLAREELMDSSLENILIIQHTDFSFKFHAISRLHMHEWNFKASLFFHSPIVIIIFFFLHFQIWNVGKRALKFDQGQIHIHILQTNSMTG